jgi:SAM-dependent methyltransferase
MHDRLPVDKFYDHIAQDYHLLYSDWVKTISDQAAVLSQMIESLLGQGKGTVLDCACGIGTQALGLASLGYTVTGTDISPKAVARAAKESRIRRLSSIHFAVADMRSLPRMFQDSFDVIICCDNPMAHLPQPGDLRLAALGFRTALRPGGIVLLSSRDYDKILPEKPSEMSFRHHTAGNRLTVAFQIWEWDAKAPVYINNHFILRKRVFGWKTSQTSTSMRAYTKQEIGDAFEASGFYNVKWHGVEETGYFQPILSAVSPS